ncbi:MAG: TetR family transcriptional regulator [Gammaproteobacteria bacterium]|nr:TetR family transcriptional regulator [Gammaproteobacteria bacterium]
MVRKTKEESDRTYHALLDAALKLFNERGTANTTLNDIAKEVAMTRGAVYWHFQNKADIIVALWNRTGLDIQQQFADGMQLQISESPDLQFREALDLCAASLIKNSQLEQVIRVLFNSMEFTAQEDGLQVFLRHTGASFFDPILSACEVLEERGFLKQGLVARHAALGLWSYMYGIMQMSAPYGVNKIDLGKDAKVLLDIYLDAILRKPPVNI